MDYKKIFLENLNELLIGKGLSKRKFSVDVGINRRTMCRWEQYCSPKPASLIKIADYFDCSIDYLLGRTENPTYYPSKKYDSFLNRYKTLKERKQMSDHKVSILCHISTGTISNWKEYTIPDFDILISLSNIFDCSIDYLLGRSEST